MRRSSLVVLVLALFAGPAAAGLAPPPGFSAAAQQEPEKKDFAQCEPPPKPYTGELAFPSKYEGSDKARDQLNPRAEKAYEAQTAGIRTMEKDFSALVDRYLQTGRTEIAACALRWLEAWAQAGALTAETEDHTGKSMRKWALGSLASAYLRLKFSASRPLADAPDATRRVEEWFGRLGRMVIRDWEDAPLAKFNNHEYWAAWAVMATAVVLDRRDWFDWALAQYRRAVGQIDAEGYLPNELARETRALHYHNYSLGPLAMIAAFAKANGVDVRDSAPALRRLALRVLEGVDDPRTFEQKTGEPQETADIRDRSKFAWLEAYCWTFGCDANLERRVAALRPIKTYRLGGNVTDLFSRRKG